MRLIWAIEALEDRRAIFEYIEARDERAALKTDELFSVKSKKLITMPGLGKPGRVLGTRELVVHRHYVLIYEVVDDQIQVLRLLHTARLWP